MKTSYVLGFLFNHAGTYVQLIRKINPDWQKGRLNGIGGKIEDGETPENAMEREFKEETGQEINTWERVCVMESKDWIVHVFRAFKSNIFDFVSMTDEVVGIDIVSCLDRRCLPGLRWLIPMCLDRELVDGGYGVQVHNHFFEEV